MPTAAGQGCICTHAHAIILAAVTPATTSLGEAVEGLPLYVMEGPLGSGSMPLGLSPKLQLQTVPHDCCTATATKLHLQPPGSTWWSLCSLTPGFHESGPSQSINHLNHTSSIPFPSMPSPEPPPVLGSPPSPSPSSSSASFSQSSTTSC